MARPGWDLLPAAIAAAAEWLRTEQPPNAIGSHLGEFTHLGDGLFVRVAGNGWNGGPGGERGDQQSARIHVNARRSWESEGYELVPDPIPFTDAELAEVRALIEATGLEIVDVWGNFSDRGPEESNAQPDGSIAPGVLDDWRSYGVRVPEGKPESLRQMYRNYSDGCPVHGGSALTRKCPEGCTGRQDGWAARVEPGWPSVPRQAPSIPEQATDDTNLDAVRRALVRLAPLVVELGIHPATMVAGKKGRIEGEEGDLEFVEEKGHGVQFPAEVAEELVRLAVIGREVES